MDARDILLANAKCTRGWERDLVREGIEPNPGPQLYWSDIKAEIDEKRWGSNLPSYEEILAQSQSTLQKPLPVDQVDNITLESVRKFVKSTPKEERSLLQKAILDSIKRMQRQDAPPLLPRRGSDFPELPIIPRPDTTPYTPKNPFLWDNLPRSPSSQETRLDLRLLTGHLDSPNEHSRVVKDCLEEFRFNNAAGKPTRIRVRGPSGSGKTKCCLDIARATTSIYIDWSRNDADLSGLIQKVGGWKSENIRESLGKELLLIIVSRFLLRHHLMNNCSFTAEDWLYYQLNGIGTMSIYIKQVLKLFFCFSP